MKKYIYISIVAFTLLSFAQTMNAQFAGGDGTQAAPYQISDRAQLEALQDFNGEAGKGKYFVLTADIDLAGQEWTAISTLFSKSVNPVPDPNGIAVLDTAFHGKLDGANHKILNMNTPRTSVYYLLGLFGQLGDGAAISNLHIDGAVTDTIFAGGMSYPRVGAIAGRILLLSDATEGVSITNCSNNMRIHNRYTNSNTGNTLGGLVGEIFSASMSHDVVISQCSNTGNITGGFHTGGLVGRITGYAVIKDSYSNANMVSVAMNGATYFGGIVGITGTEGEITNCYAAGTIDNTLFEAGKTAAHISGGILGRPVENTPLQNISNCVALQDFIAYRTANDDGVRTSFRIQGHGSNNVTRANNYAATEMVMKDIETVVPVTGATVALDGKDGADVTLATAKTQAFYESLGWDFTNTWQINEGNAYPTLKGGLPTGFKVPQLDKNRLQVSAFNGVLTVKGLVPGEKLNVYTPLGQVVSGKTVTSTETTVSLPASGIYLVSSGNRTVKVINK